MRQRRVSTVVLLMVSVLGWTSWFARDAFLAWVNPAPAAQDSLPMLVVGNVDSNDLATFGLDPAEVASHFAAQTPLSLVADASGRVVYALNAASGEVWVLRRHGRQLERVQAVGCGLRPRAMALHPSGQWLYVTNVANDTVEVFRVQPDATLSFRTVASTGGSPLAVVPHPSGRQVYVVDALTDDVRTYDVDLESGALTFIGEAPCGRNPVGLTVDPDGRFAWVANYRSDDVSMFTIDPQTGELELTGTIYAANMPSAIVASRGQVYLASAGTGYVQTFDVDRESGWLTPLSSLPVGDQPVAISLSRDRTKAAVANYGSSDITLLNVDATTGALNAPRSLPCGRGPATVVLLP